MQAALDKSKEFPTTQPEAKFNAAQPVPDVESALAGKAASFAADNVITQIAIHQAGNDGATSSSVTELKQVCNRPAIMNLSCGKDRLNSVGQNWLNRLEWL